MKLLLFLRDLLFFCAIAILVSQSLVLDCYTDPPQSVSIQEDISKLENITNSASSNQNTDNANPLFKKNQLTVALSTELKQSPNLNAPNLGILLPGEKVEVIAFHSEWYAVLFNNSVVYIAAKPTTNNQEVVTMPEKEDAMVSTDSEHSDSELTIEQTTRPSESETTHESNKRPNNNNNNQPVSSGKNNEDKNSETKPETTPNTSKNNNSNTSNDSNSTNNNDVVYYNTVDEYVYVTANSLNIRSGPSTECKIIGKLAKGAKIHRIAVSECGWSKIEYNDAVGHVASKYLSNGNVQSEKPPVTNTISALDEIKTRDGMYARLTIPDVGLSVALFDQSVSKSSQAIVDREDSAAYLYAKAGWGMDIIADHNFQGLERMKASVPNQTYAYLDFGTHKEKYICVKNFVGQNWKSDLVDTEGKSIKGQNNDGIAMYTCNIYYPYVTITFWQRVD